jgi:PRTRC genetic system protein E
MFTSLHALAQQATLMITIAAEGADQLRVNVTPMPFDDKAKAQLPKPLSLLATPAEFDADFIAALATWQAPKRSLVEQAQDAGESEEQAAPPAPVVKAPAKDGKTSRKAATRASKPAAAEPDQAGLQAAGEAAGEAAAAVDAVMAGSERSPQVADVVLDGSEDKRADTHGDEPEPQPEVQAVAEVAPADAMTLDLF